MIPLLQTIFADPTRDDGHDENGVAGNCYQAAIASALNLPLDEVPHFSNMEGDLWWTESHDWYLSRGLMRGCLHLENNDGPFAFPVYADPNGDWPNGHRPGEVVAILGSGPSPRGSFRHIVVLDPDTGVMIHDPHPSGAGVVEVDELEILIEAL